MSCMKQPKPDRLVVIEGIPIYSQLSVETREARKRATTYYSALGRRIAPWFVIAGKHPEMAPSNKLFIVHTKYRVICIQKIRVKDNLYAVMRRVEEFHTSYLIQNGIVWVICHVVCCHGRERVAFERKDASLQLHLVLLRE